MISISNLSVQFGGTYLFEDVSFLINKGDRIGLTGKNGAGKSTMLKLLAKTQVPESGSITKPKECTVGYLAQDLKTQGGKTVMEETRLAFEELKRVENHLHELTEQVVNATDHSGDSYMDLLNDLHEVTEKYSMLSAGNPESEMEKVLLGLGFERKDFNRLTDEFSGGWRMRIELAKILLQLPDLILLDEPTNHLDIESIQWLESWLKNYNGTVLLVSHDRAFLDNVTNRTIEISLGKIYDYKASYTRYITLRKERMETIMNAKRNQENEIRKTEQLISKFRAKANKATFAQSLIKQLDRMEIIEVDDEDNSSIHFRFPDAPRSGQLVVDVNNVTKKYGEKTILKNIKFQVQRGERIAFVGRNGEGKTTLSKLIVGEETYEGEIKLGHNVEVAYYAQHQAEKLNPDATVFDIIDRDARGEMRTKVRSLLGAFLFGGEAIDKKVKVLSGGEKSRLALAHMLLEPASLLVLDEPTNHLDMRSKEVLKEALMNYNGTLIIISHDRDFLQELTNKLYYFRDQKVREYIGEVNDFLKEINMETLKQLETKKEVEKKIEEKKPRSTEVKSKDNSKEISKLSKQISQSEKRISDFELAMIVLEKKLAHPENISTDELMTLSVQYEKLKQDLEKEMQIWTKLGEEKGFLEM